MELEAQVNNKSDGFRLKPAAAMLKYAVVTNIPSTFRAADLRAHFSSLVESKSFTCFHFRHRPEKNRNVSPEKVNNINVNNQNVFDSKETEKEDKKCCCIVKMCTSKLEQFLKYSNHHWTDHRGEIYGDVCEISELKVKEKVQSSETPEPSNNTDNNSGEADEEILLSMPELKPPELMPQGNVGTPTMVFFNLIHQCLLPQSLVDKLKLQFPKTRSKRLYDSVHYHYEDRGEGPCNSRRKERSPEATSTPSFKVPSVPHKPSDINNVTGTSEDLQNKGESNARSVACIKEKSCLSHKVLGKHSAFSSASTSTANDEEKEGSSSLCNDETSAEKTLSNRERRKQKKADNKLTRKLMAENIEETLIANERKYYNDEDAEEWDRHEASEDDPSNQERNKERLYEEEIEQPWEKGGPGVVFYTDAMYWQEKEGDFDEQTTDDLDVDFSAYEEPGTGDMDIKDFLKIRQEQRFRNGYDKTDRFSIGIGKKAQIKTASTSKESSPRIGAFEKHSKGIGRKLMEQQGWREGQGLGTSRPGITQALKGEGQSAHNKRGLGYVDEEQRKYGPSAVKSSKHKKSHLITTVYDDPRQTDPQEPLLMRSEPTTLKHRQSHIDTFKKKE